MREEDSGELHSDSMGFGEDDDESKSVASVGPHMASFHHSGSSKDHSHGNNNASHNTNNKFHQRMEQEDAMFHEKLVEGRAARRGDGTLFPHIFPVILFPCVGFFVSFRSLCFSTGYGFECTDALSFTSHLLVHYFSPSFLLQR